MKLLLSVLIGLLAASPLVTAQPPRPASTTRPAGELLSITGKIPKPLSLTAKSLTEMPRKEVRAKDHEGKEAVYSGVTLAEILKRAGAPIGNHQMRGENAALYMLAEAADGYRVVFALAEVDEEIAEKNMLIADMRDGKPLDAKEGPLRIVIPGEKRPARWIRQLVSIKVESAGPAKE